MRITALESPVLRRKPARVATLFILMSALLRHEVLAANIQLEEVVVTAQKRTESLQTVPVSVSAFTAGDLADIGFSDVEDLVSYVPSLTVGTNVSPLSTTFRIRNIGKAANIPSFEPATGLFIDGAFRARSGLGLGDLVDVQSVEVLKGPQSTLYGKNVSAGVVSVATQHPTEEFDAMLELTVGEDELRQIKSYISGPLTSSVSARLSLISTDRGPWMKNLVGEDHDDLGSTAVRGQLEAAIGDRITSRLIVGYVEKDLHPMQGDVWVSEASTAVIRNAGGQVTNNDPKDRVVEYDDQNAFIMDAIDVIWTNIYESERATFTSITSYDDYDSIDKLHDAEQMSLSVAIYNDVQWGRTLSQEFRVDVVGEGRLDWLGGLFFYRNELRHGDRRRPEFLLEEDVEELGDAIAEAILGGTPIPGPLVPVIGVEGDRGDFLALQDTDAFGVFSKFDFRLSEAWTASLGLRYSYEDKAASLVQSNELSDMGCIPGLDSNFICTVTPEGNNFDQSDVFDAVTGSLQTTYFITGETMLYATASTGFKAGGYSLQFGVAPPESRPYGEEEIVNVELGWKSEFWSRRARINGAVFSTEYKDFQEASYRGLYFIVNSAELVTVDGLELDMTLLLTDQLSFNLGLQWVHSVYEEYTGGRCYYGRQPDNAFGQCDLSGDEVPGARKLKGVATLEWATSLAQGTFYTRWDAVYHDSANSSSELDPRFNQDAYALLNGRVGWRTSQWDIALWGNNLTDEVYVTQSAPANVITPIDEAIGSPVGSYQHYTGFPRSVALTTRFFF